jgi:hypothetical protein
MGRVECLGLVGENQSFTQRTGNISMLSSSLAADPPLSQWTTPLGCALNPKALEPNKSAEANLNPA